MPGGGRGDVFDRSLGGLNGGKNETWDKRVESNRTEQNEMKRSQTDFETTINIDIKTTTPHERFPAWLVCSNELRAAKTVGQMDGRMDRQVDRQTGRRCGVRESRCMTHGMEWLDAVYLPACHDQGSRDSRRRIILAAGKTSLHHITPHRITNFLTGWLTGLERNDWNIRLRRDGADLLSGR